MHAKSLQLWMTLWDLMDCSPPGSSAHVILLARILEQVAISVPGILPDPGIEPGSPALQADSLPLGHLGSPNNNNLTLRKKTRRSSQFWCFKLIKLWEYHLSLNFWWKLHLSLTLKCDNYTRYLLFPTINILM